MGFLPLPLTLLTFALSCSFHLILGQQPYGGLSTNNCNGNDGSLLGYTYNGLNQTCQAYLTFRSQPSYNSVSAISALLGSDPSQLSVLNSVSEDATFESNKLVLVPLNCSSSGQYYQANTSYVVKHDDTLILIAYSVFQGLSTCQAIVNQNNINPDEFIVTGTRYTVPLRCACPTKNQSDEGVKYLLSYIVGSGDAVSIIANRFGVSTDATLLANGLSYENPTIYPNTTILVPLLDEPSSSQTTVPPPPPSTPPPSTPSPPPGGKSNRTWIYVLVGVLGGVALAAVFFTLLYCRVSRRTSRSKKKADPVIASESFEAIEKGTEGKKVEEESEELSEIISDIAKSLRVYRFEELKDATDNFSPSCWIKGSVYRGTFNGDLAAIKKMDGDVSKEISLLSKVNHSNLIRLSGVSFSDGHWYFVYEYAAKGSLSEWIYFNNSDGKFLSWTRRIQIALDVANGLNYLHSFTSPPHVHKDLRSSNILLDSDFRAKIANFGLARSAEGQEGEFSLTRHIVGTRGYMAPEYLENGFVSTKLDVYAFGVLMLEMLSGKEIAAFYTEEIKNLSNVLSDILSEEDGQEKLREFMDPTMKGNYPLELSKFVVRIINSCLVKDPAGRPCMDEIVQSLSRTLETSLTYEVSSNISSSSLST